VFGGQLRSCLVDDKHLVPVSLKTDSLFPGFGVTSCGGGVSTIPKIGVGGCMSVYDVYGLYLARKFSVLAGAQLGRSLSVGAFTRIGEKGCSVGLSGAIRDNLQIGRREMFSR
jgi:hypothetical protein